MRPGNRLHVGPTRFERRRVAVDFDGTGLGVEWLVPTLVVTVPGILLIFAVLAQGAGAMLWLPYVRRTLGGDRRRRPSRHTAR